MKIFLAAMALLALLLALGCTVDGRGLSRQMSATSGSASDFDSGTATGRFAPEAAVAAPDAGASPDTIAAQASADAAPKDTRATPDSAAALADTGRPDSLPMDTRPALPDTADTSMPPDAYRPPPDAMPKDTFPDIIPCPYDPDKGLMGPVICDSPVFCGQRCVYYVNGSGKTVCTCGGCGTPSRWQLTGC